MNAPVAAHVLVVPDETGDTKLTWEVDNKPEVDAAREMFDKLKGKGYLAFKVDKQGDKAEQIRKFDPELGMIIMAAPVVGG